MNATDLKSQIGTLRQSSSANYAKWKSKIKFSPARCRPQTSMAEYPQKIKE